MRSSSGAHFIALDHVRALAAFIVFTWHFIHAPHGYPIPFDYTPGLFPFAILDEGHTGVALFMTLSGYLFAKLLDRKAINYRLFIWNRALRLLPLLLFVIVIVGIMRIAEGQPLYDYAYTIAMGAIHPSLPNGGWSITVEFHYYLILPFLLWLLAKSKGWAIAVIAAAVALRFFLHQEKGEIQSLAYWTIVGRIDQFVLGMLAYGIGSCLAKRHLLILAISTAFMTMYWYFDLRGGFFQYPSYPSPSRFWIILPTLEGLVYASVIAWYDRSFTPSGSGVSKFLGRLGEYSYSIYLLHFFVVFDIARFINERIMDISNFYLACLWALLTFILMLIPAYLSFRFIESPFLRLRKNYVLP